MIKAIFLMNDEQSFDIFFRTY
ncbi:protein of unknown function [Thiomonas sp. Bio17B3]|nr:protein of unknown function [Thiomonas sp. Bio17B3]